MKKRFLSVLTALVMLITVATCLVTEVAAAQLGDIDFDNQITAADARLVLRASVGLENFTEEQNAIADVNNDGFITAADARIILRMSVGLEALHEHSYTSKITKAATCTEKGTKTFTCECGNSFTEEIAALGHTGGTATCTSPKTCSRCNTDYETALGHDFSSGICTRCGLNEQIISSSEMVWIPTNGGKKYHSKSTCSQMIDPEYVTVSQAISQGFTPCAKCH